MTKRQRDVLYLALCRCLPEALAARVFLWVMKWVDGVSLRDRAIGLRAPREMSSIADAARATREVAA